MILVKANSWFWHRTQGIAFSVVLGIFSAINFNCAGTKPQLQSPALPPVAQAVDSSRTEENEILKILGWLEGEDTAVVSPATHVQVAEPSEPTEDEVLEILKALEKQPNATPPITIPEDYFTNLHPDTTSGIDDYFNNLVVDNTLYIYDPEFAAAAEKGRWRMMALKDREARKAKLGSSRRADRQLYTPAIQFAEEGLASYYGEPFHGRRMANRQIFNMNDPELAAHPSLPFGTPVRVTDSRTGKSIEVTITDRGPTKPGRIIDLSLAGAQLLADDAEEIGLIPVKIEPLLDPSKSTPAWPVHSSIGKNYTSPFGEWRYLNSRSYPHNGLDIDGKLGDPVTPILPGFIAGTRKDSAYGLHIFVSHGSGLVSKYAHLSQILVTKGFISSNTVIGKVGSTGDANGTHLHISIYENGVAVDPFKYLDKTGAKYTPVKR